MKKFHIQIVCVLFFISFVGVKAIFSQSGTKSKFAFQFEYGINYTHYYQNFEEGYRYNGTGSLYSRESKSWNWSLNYYFAYKLIYKDKHAIKFSNSHHSLSSNLNLAPPQTDKEGVFYYLYAAGYGYKLPINKVSCYVYGLLNYRWQGGEGATYGWRSNPNWNEPVYTARYYNSPWGFGAGFELEYFVTKNIGIGINTYFNAFPCENSKFEASTFPKPTEEFNNKYPANKYFINSNFKIAYKFAIPKLFKPKSE